MGILVLAVVAGSVSAVVALIAGYGLASVLAIYCLAGLGSIVLIAMPLMWVCSMRKGWARNEHKKLKFKA